MNILTAETKAAADAFQEGYALIRPFIGWAPVIHAGSSFFIEEYKDVDIIVGTEDFGPSREELVVAILNGLPGSTLESENYYDTCLQSIRYNQFNIIVMDTDAFKGTSRANEVLKLLSCQMRNTDECIASKDFRVALNRIVRDGISAEETDGKPY